MTRQYIQTQQGMNALIEQLKTMNIPEHGIIVEIKMGKRTTQQNSAIWRYFDLLATELNDSGQEIHMEYLGKSVDIPWSKDSIHDRLWVPVMHALTGYMSTTKLDRKQVSEVYDVLSRHLAEVHGVLVSFPSNEPPMV